MPEKVYKLEIPSDPGKLPEIDKFIDNIAAENSLDEELANRLSLSVSEAASNGIIHGNKKDKTKKIEITVTFEKSSVRAVIKDEGKGFEPAEVPDPTEPENILKDNGRGIYIMKTYLDTLSYNFTPTGTEAILELKLN